jgi:hypothetical protein
MTSPKKTALRKGSREAEMLSPTTSGAGERRSGRSRQEVATYSDKDNIRAAAGLIVITSPKQASETFHENIHNGGGIGSGSHNIWTAEEDGQLRRAREAGKSWLEIQKVPEIHCVYILQALMVNTDPAPQDNARTYLSCFFGNDPSLHCNTIFSNHL